MSKILNNVPHLTVARVEFPCLERSVGSVERMYVLLLHFFLFLPARERQCFEHGRCVKILC